MHTQTTMPQTPHSGGHKGLQAERTGCVGVFTEHGIFAPSAESAERIQED